LKDAAKKLGAPPPNVGRLSEVATQLALLQSQVRTVARSYDELCRLPDGGASELSGMAFSLQINHLKLGASELVADICMRALRLTGTTGYRNDSPYSVTRNLRDALSAALMIGNERIHANTGVLQLAHKGDAL
jgi:acyl-CoA dehydrogenase